MGGRGRIALLAAAGLASGGGCGHASTRSAATRAAAPPGDTVRATATVISRPVARGFVGLSLEYAAVTAYAGAQPRAINPLFTALLRGLDPQGGLVLRIGGDSTDWTWWPLAGQARPAGVSESLSPRWAAVLRALARATGARLILGINLEAGRPALAAGEARALLAALGRQRVEALEIGNEPEQYAQRWYRGPTGAWVPGRPRGYDLGAWTRELARWRAALPRIALAAPATGDPSWLRELPTLLAAEPELREVTVHRYPLSHCITDPASPGYPTIAHLLSPMASRGLLAGLAPAIAAAHRAGRTFRIDELNAVTCQGRAGVSDSFASALWALDALFAMARAGVDAVNVHMWPGAPANQPFTLSERDGRWTATVRPLYLGLLLFNRAAPPGSSLLAVRAPAADSVRVWATRTPDRDVNVVLVNPSPTRPATVAVQTAGATGSAHLVRLEAPSAGATGGVTLGGSGFGAQTSTGRLPDAPRAAELARGPHGYVVVMPSASAALLTVPETVPVRRAAAP